MGGIYGGYNLQLGHVVLGLEGDIQASGVSGAFQNNSGITSAASTREGWGGALRARLGYASDNLLLYVAGGVTYAQFDYRGSPQTLTPCCGYSSARAGYTIGAGAEYAIRENLVGRLEYRYSDFGKTSGSLSPTYPDVAMRASNSDHIARIGIAYKFGAQPGSTVTKY